MGHDHREGLDATVRRCLVLPSPRPWGVCCTGHQKRAHHRTTRFVVTGVVGWYALPQDQQQHVTRFGWGLGPGVRGCGLGACLWGGGGLHEKKEKTDTASCGEG